MAKSSPEYAGSLSLGTWQEAHVARKPCRVRQVVESPVEYFAWCSGGTACGGQHTTLLPHHMRSTLIRCPCTLSREACAPFCKAFNRCLEVSGVIVIVVLKCSRLRRASCALMRHEGDRYVSDQPDPPAAPRMSCWHLPPCPSPRMSASMLSNRLSAQAQPRKLRLPLTRRCLVRASFRSGSRPSKKGPVRNGWRRGLQLLGTSHLATLCSGMSKWS